jgi:hypothetical protein
MNTPCRKPDTAEAIPKADAKDPPPRKPDTAETVRKADAKDNLIPKVLLNVGVLSHSALSFPNVCRMMSDAWISSLQDLANLDPSSSLYSQDKVVEVCTCSRFSMLQLHRPLLPVRREDSVDLP